MSAPEERAAIRAFLLTLEGKNGLQIADAIEDYLAPYARRLEEARAAIRWLRSEPRGVPGEGLVSTEDDWAERDEWQRGYDIVKPALGAALLAPERQREERG